VFVSSRQGTYCRYYDRRKWGRFTPALLEIASSARCSRVTRGMRCLHVRLDKFLAHAQLDGLLAFYADVRAFLKAAAYAPSLPQSWMRCYSVRSCLFDHAPSRGRSSFIQEE
jgi:hypothetical protein